MFGMSPMGISSHKISLRKDLAAYLRPSANLSVYDRINHLRDFYQDYLKKNFPQEDSVLYKINAIWDTILESFSLYSKGLCADAVEVMYNDLFSNLELNIDVIHGCINGGLPLFRMRYSADGERFSKKEMFHVPISLRHIIKNERFSVTGMPMLYLASSAYICWEEMGRKNFDNCNISSFHALKDLRVLQIDPLWGDFKEDMIYNYPLSLACFLEVEHVDGAYKEEYIIPQIFMQCILKYNHTHKETPISGVKYLSSRVMRDGVLFPIDNPGFECYNYALLATEPYNEDGFSEVLIDSLYYSSPLIYGITRLVVQQKPVKSNNAENYENSAFRFMESQCEYHRIIEYCQEKK